MADEKDFKQALIDAASGALPPMTKRGIESITPEMIYNSTRAEILDRSTYPSGGWLRAPAIFELFSTATKRLIQVSRMRGTVENWVSQVRVALEVETQRVYIFPTHADDPEAIRVRRDGNRAQINLRSLLAPAGYLVKPGYRVRLAVEIADADSPVGPALVLALDQPIERRMEPPSRRPRTRSRRSSRALGPSGA